MSYWINLSHEKGECSIEILDKLYHITQEKVQEAYWIDQPHNTRKVLRDKFVEPVTQHRSMIKRRIGWFCNTTHENV